MQKPKSQIKYYKEYLRNPKENYSGLATEPTQDNHFKGTTEKKLAFGPKGPAPHDPGVQEDDLPETLDNVDLGELPFIVREAKPKDLTWIKASWLTGQYNFLCRKPHTTPIPSLYMNAGSLAVDHCLRRSRVLVAETFIDGESFLIGFCVVEIPPENYFKIKHVVHWVHTRRTFWNLGIATTLLKHIDINSKYQEGVIFTGQSPFLKFKYFKDFKWTYLPLWLMPSLSEGHNGAKV